MDALRAYTLVAAYGMGFLRVLFFAPIFMFIATHKKQTNKQKKTITNGSVSNFHLLAVHDIEF